jgi:type I restriction enzyme S subunit
MEWTTKGLDEVLFIQEGPGIRKYEYEDDGYPMINVRCVQDGYVDMSKSRSANYELATNKWKHFQVEENDILYTISGTIGRSAIVKKTDLPLLMNTSVVRFRSLTECLDTKFVYYCFKTETFINELLGHSTGTAIKNVGPSHLKKMKISYPSIPEQKRIVALLDTVFADLEQTRAKTERNLKNARELFDSYLQQVFSQKGEGWEEHKLSDLCVLISGQHIDAKNYNTDNIGIGYLTGPSDFGSLNPIVTKWTEHPKRTSIAGDILITVKGSGVGKVNIMSSPELAISRQLMAVRATSAVGGLLYWFLSMQFDYFQSLANGAAIPGISRHNVLDLELSIPKLSDQPSLLEKIIAFNSQTVRLENVYVEKIKAIDELKKSILQKAFSGELNTEVK